MFQFFALVFVIAKTRYLGLDGGAGLLHDGLLGDLGGEPVKVGGGGLGLLGEELLAPGAGVPLVEHVTLSPNLHEGGLPGAAGHLDLEISDGHPLGADHLAAHTGELLGAVDEELRREGEKGEKAQ